MQNTHFLTAYTKIYLKQIKHLNIRPETIKVLEDNIGSRFFDICPRNIFLDVSQARKTKAKINNWDYIKLKSFCTVKETIRKTKGQPTEWEKIFPTKQLTKE